MYYLQGILELCMELLGISVIGEIVHEAKSHELALAHLTSTKKSETTVSIQNQVTEL